MQMKKFYFLTSALIFSSTCTFAAWDGSQADWEKGTGTSEDPYIIENEAQFSRFQQNVTGGESYEGKYFSLAADLDMGGLDMPPVGLYDDYTLDNKEYYESKAFLGTFDGCYHSIDNLNVKFAGDLNVGGCGLFAVGRENTVIKNLVLGENVTVNSLEAYDCGGIIGVANGSSILNCINHGKVIGGGGETGGIAGMASAGSVIDCCAFTGRIDAASMTGGIAGYTEGTTVSNCYNTGEINCPDAFYAAGIIGWAYRNTKIEKCYAIGKVSASVGSVWIAGQSPVCAELEQSTAANCYYVAALCGCSPLTSQNGITGVTEEEMKGEAILSSLNNGSSTWATGSEGYPVFSWENNISSGLFSIEIPECTIKVSGDMIVATGGSKSELTLFDTNGRMIFTTVFDDTVCHRMPGSGLYIAVVTSAGHRMVRKLAL